jgi:hypothetical protein
MAEAEPLTVFLSRHGSAAAVVTTVLKEDSPAYSAVAADEYTGSVVCTARATEAGTVALSRYCTVSVESTTRGLNTVQVTLCRAAVH